jgi:hypothetical protein
MKKLIVAFWFFVSIISCMQAQNFDYQNAKFVRLNLIENKKNISEFDLNYTILKNTEAIFCYADFRKKTIIVVVDKKVDIINISNELNNLGFLTNNLIVKDYNDKYFMELYKNFKYVSETNDLIIHKILTRNSEKDETNYQKAIKILNQNKK